MSHIIAGDPAPTNPTAREQLFRRVAGAFVDEAKANALLDAFCAEVLAEAADRLANTSPDRDVDFTDGVDWAVETLKGLASEGGAR